MQAHTHGYLGYLRMTLIDDEWWYPVLWNRGRTFLLEQEPVKQLQLRPAAVRLRGSVVAKLRQFL